MTYASNQGKNHAEGDSEIIRRLFWFQIGDHHLAFNRPDGSAQSFVGKAAQNPRDGTLPSNVLEIVLLS